MRKKKALTIDEICCGMPRLKRHFKAVENQIKRFDMEGVKNPAVEDLKERERQLLDTIAQMDYFDLRVLYYLKNIERIKVSWVLNILKKLHDAAKELEDFSKANLK